MSDSDPQRANPQPWYPEPTYSPTQYEPPSYSTPPAPAQWPGYDQRTAAEPPPYQQAIQPYQQPAAPAYHGQHTGMAYPPPTSGQLVSAGGRFGALLLDGLLMAVTLWIGWLVWSLFTWVDGQSPAKKMLGHVVADPLTGQPFDWGRMAVRELCVKGLLGTLLNLISFGVYSWVDSFMVFGDRQRTLHDRIAGSVVRHR